MPYAIEKGGPAAWVAHHLIHGWFEDDEDRFADALAAAESLQDKVFMALVNVAGGMVEMVAVVSKRPYEEVLSVILEQLAANDPGTDETSVVMREILTAWTTGDDAAAEFLNRSGVLQEVDIERLFAHLIAFAEMVARRYTEWSGEPIEDALEGIRRSLGTSTQESPN